MKIAHINMTSFGSTGTIMFHIAEEIRKCGVEALTYSPYPHPTELNRAFPERELHCVYGTRFERYASLIVGRFFGLNGLSMRHGTKKMITDMKKKHVDVIHLHNLHSYCIHFPLLLKFIKKNHIKVVWTLHDCWAFTGHCAHFTLVECSKWKSACKHCPQINCYPKSLIDSSGLMYRLKKKWFTGVENLTIVTPSQWLADLVNQSFLKDYPVKVVNNGIDLKIFKPTESNFRSKHNIPDHKKLLLGVSFGWGYKKGLDVFIELSKRLDGKQYQIVLVGTDDAIDKQLPSNIISIHRTQNQQELAEIYSSADLFVNPTREENYPTVNMEAIACGTPVLTFRTGGSPEIVDDTCGAVVDCDDIDSMEQEIIRICTERPYSIEKCLFRASQFDMNAHFKAYIDVYKGR